MKIASIIIILIGISLIGYSVTLEPYTNKTEYEEKYYALEGENRSEKFYELRETYLTEKYSFENYGMTFLIAGTFLLIFFFKGWNSFKIPKHKTIIGLIGLGAVLVTTFGYVGDLFLEMYRGRYPHWADSMGIPLASVPIIFIILFVWFALNLIGLTNPFKTGGLIRELNFKGISYWYAALLFLTVVFTGVLIFEGDFWWTTAGFLWIYYYLSLLVGRREGKIENGKINKWTET